MGCIVVVCTVVLYVLGIVQRAEVFVVVLSGFGWHVWRNGPKINGKKVFSKWKVIIFELSFTYL